MFLHFAHLHQGHPGLPSHQGVLGFLASPVTGTEKDAALRYPIPHGQGWNLRLMELAKQGWGWMEKETSIIIIIVYYPTKRGNIALRTTEMGMQGC